MPQVLEGNGGPQDREIPKKIENPLNSENQIKNEISEKNKQNLHQSLGRLLYQLHDNVRHIKSSLQKIQRKQKEANGKRTLIKVF